MIDLKKLKELVKLMVANDLTELDLQGDGESVTLKRGPGEPKVVYAPAPVEALAGPAKVVESAVGGGPAASSPGADDGQRDDGLVAINSPMVGTFYASPSPDAKAFVSLGDTVNAETVVCIIEAMKVFNEIKAETAGTIEKVLAENGQAVEFGQALYLVKP